MPIDGRSPLSRRRLLGVGGTAIAWVVAMPTRRDGAGGPGGAVTVRSSQRGTATAKQGRLRARPVPTAELAAPPASVATGLQPLELDDERDGLLYVPTGYRPGRPAPLVLMLHGAGGEARGGIDPFLGLADEAGLILLAPDSRGRTWDVILGEYGPDVAFIDRALATTFGRFAVAAGRVEVEGFSDGASYALSLGITNGDLFGYVIAFSPGFAAPGAEEGNPRVFVSHGVADTVLPIEATSRRVVPRLRRAGYDVTYREFDGSHTVPPELVREAVDWFLTTGVGISAVSTPSTPD